MKHDALSRLALAGLLVFANTCMAQISISTGAEDVQIGGDGSIRIKNGGNKMTTHDNEVSTTANVIKIFFTKFTRRNPIGPTP